MNILSSYLIKSIIEERDREAQRLAKARRRAKVANDQPKKNFWQSLKIFARHMRYGPHLPDEVEQDEQTLIHAEMLGLSPEELRRQEAKRRMYERIAQGNALAEAENLARKMREGRL